VVFGPIFCYYFLNYPRPLDSSEIQTELAACQIPQNPSPNRYQCFQTISPIFIDYGITSFDRNRDYCVNQPVGKRTSSLRLPVRPQSDRQPACFPARKPNGCLLRDSPGYSSNPTICIHTCQPGTCKPGKRL